jgi:hypothetical protein
MVASQSWLGLRFFCCRRAEFRRAKLLRSILGEYKLIGGFASRSLHGDLDRLPGDRRSLARSAAESARPRWQSPMTPRGAVPCSPSFYNHRSLRRRRRGYPTCSTSRRAAVRLMAIARPQGSGERDRSRSHRRDPAAGYTHVRTAAGRRLIEHNTSSASQSPLRSPLPTNAFRR